MNKKLLACYSRVVWLAAVSLSKWFHENEHAHRYLQGCENVLELGTGTGLLGIYLGLKFQALEQPAKIVLTDLEKPSLEITQQNVNLNGLKQG